MLRNSYHRMLWEFAHSGMMSDFAGNLFRAGHRVSVAGNEAGTSLPVVVLEQGRDSDVMDDRRPDFMSI
jgi:hypothetical protein